MDFEKALELLGLQADFTKDELQRQYKKLLIQADGKSLEDIKLAYEILDGGFQTSLFSFKEQVSVQEIGNDSLSEEEQNKYLAQFIKETHQKELEIFTMVPNECPEYVNQYYSKILKVVEESLNQTQTSDYFHYCLTGVREIYKELILTYCRESGYYVGNIDDFIHEITFGDEVIKQSIGDFFEYIKVKIREQFNQTQIKLKNFISKTIDYYAMKDLPSRHYTMEDYKEVSEGMESVKNHLLSLYAKYIIIHNNSFTDMSEVIDSTCRLIRQEHFEKKYNSITNITNRMNQEYRKIPGSAEFKWDIDQVFRDAIKYFKGEDLYYGHITVNEVEAFVDSRVNLILQGFRVRYQKLEELMQLYPFVTREELTSVARFLYPEYYAQSFDKSYQELVSKLESEKDNRNVSDDCNFKPILLRDTSFDLKQGEYFLVYCGDNLELDDVLKKIQTFIPQDYVVNVEGIKDKLFLKIVERHDKHYMDPYLTDRENIEKSLLTVSGYDLNEIKSVSSQHLSVADEKLCHKVISTLYTKNGIETFNIVEPEMALASVIYDSRYDEFVMGVCGSPNQYTHLYVGKVTNETGYMCSNNAAMLSMFCEEVYELPPNTCIVNGVLKNLKTDTRLLLKRY